MSYNPQNRNGQTNSDNSQPVVIASDQSSVPVTVTSGKIDVNAIVDKSGLATSTTQSDGSQKSQIVDPGGEAATVTGGKLDVNATVDNTGLATSTKQDTGNTSLSSIDGKITTVNTGSIAGTVTANAGTNLNTSALAVETGGNLDDITTMTTASAVSLGIMDDWDESDRAKVNPIVGQTGVQGGSGAVSNNTQRTVLATDVALPAGTGALNTIGKIAPNDYELAGNTTHAKKYYTNAGAVTNGEVWVPATGKRWYVTDMFINVSAAATVTLEDGLVAGDSAVWKAEFAANSGVFMSFNTPLYSGEDGAKLYATTTAGNVYITVTGYEI